jgi:hypothetical protein
MQWCHACGHYHINRDGSIQKCLAVMDIVGGGVKRCFCHG